MRQAGGLQGPECYSICPDWAGGVPDGSPHIIFVANVNFDDDGQLKVNVNRLSNDNVWNAENRHRIVVPKLMFLSLLRGESFAKCRRSRRTLQPFAPTAEHASYLLELFREPRVLIGRYELAFPGELKKEFERIQFRDGPAEHDDLALGRQVYAGKAEFESVQEQSLDLLSDPEPFDAREIPMDKQPELICFLFLQYHHRRFFRERERERELIVIF